MLVIQFPLELPLIKYVIELEIVASMSFLFDFDCIYAYQLNNE